MSNTTKLPSYKHSLHKGYSQPLLRQWQSSGNEIYAHNLMYPLFITDEPDNEEPIPSMPGISRFGVDRLVDHLIKPIANGLTCVMLFGVPTNIEKDERGSHADVYNNPVIQAIPILKEAFPKLIIACDVCLCAYTSHGHCGILDPDGLIDNAASIERLAEQALSYAMAGAHIVAPSDMMDGRVGAISQILRANKFDETVTILSYAVKFASAFYGPFRDAAQSAPAFGDRKCYQLPPGSSGLALRAAERDVEEGASFLMVKPGLAYLDLVAKTKQHFPNHPLFVYQVSGEYSMLIHAAKNGVFGLKPIVMETLTAFRRAGADVIISYFTPQVLHWIAEK